MFRIKKNKLFLSGEATKVKINVLIRSMGPISEEDMVIQFFREDSLWSDFLKPFNLITNRITQWTVTSGNTGVTTGLDSLD